MLNADSSTLKSESELQSSTTPPTMPRVAEFFWIERTASRIVCSERRRERALELVDQEARLVEAPGEAEQREREEQQRDEREQPEVRDHRREVRPAVGEELVEDRTHCPRVWRRGPLVGSARGSGAGARGRNRDLVPDRGGGAARRGRGAARVERRGRSRRASGRRRRRPAARRGRRGVAARGRLGRPGSRPRRRAERLRRSRGRADRRRHDRPRADGRPRLLRPQELPPQPRRAGAGAEPEPEPEAEPAAKARPRRGARRDA